MSEQPRREVKSLLELNLHTRTKSTYIHNHFVKRIMSDYECHSECNSRNGDCTPKHKYKPRGSAGTLPCKLAKVNNGPVCSRHSKGVRNRVYFEPSPTSSTISNPIGPKPTGIGIARDHRIDLKSGGDRGANPTGGWVFLHPSSGAEKRWRPETSHKPEEAKLVHRRPPLQDGGDPYSQKLNPFPAMTGGFNPGESEAYKNIFNI